MTIYLVWGSKGEYSDRSEWVEKAYRTESTAANEVLRLERENREEIARDRRLNAYFDLAHYTVQEVELVDE